MSTNEEPSDERGLSLDQFFEAESYDFVKGLRTEVPPNAHLHGQIILYTGPICLADFGLSATFEDQVLAMRENLQMWVGTIRVGFYQLTDEKVEWENKIHPEHNPHGFVGRWKYSARLYSIISSRQVESLESVS